MEYRKPASLENTTSKPIISTPGDVTSDSVINSKCNDTVISNQDNHTSDPPICGTDNTTPEAIIGDQDAAVVQDISTVAGPSFSPEQQQRFQTRYEEGFDIPGEISTTSVGFSLTTRTLPSYVVKLKLKNLTLSLFQTLPSLSTSQVLLHSLLSLLTLTLLALLPHQLLLQALHLQRLQSI